MQIFPLSDRKNNYQNFLEKYLDKIVWITGVDTPPNISFIGSYLQPVRVKVILKQNYNKNSPGVLGVNFQFQSLKDNTIYDLITPVKYGEEKYNMTYHIFDKGTEADKFFNSEIQSLIEDCKDGIEEIKERIEKYKRIKV